MDELTDKQRLFAERYADLLNATEAARQAGYRGSYAVLRSIASENLTKPNIRALVDHLISQRAMPKGEVLARIQQQSEANINDFVIFGKNGHITGLKKKAIKERGHLIKKIGTSQGKTNSISVELYDAQAALLALAKIHGMMTDKTDHSGEVTIRIVDETSHADD